MPRLDKIVEGQTPKSSFILGLSWGIAIISIIALGVLGYAFFAEKNTNVNGDEVAANVNTNANTNTPPSQPPQGDASKLSSVTNNDHIRGEVDAKITMIEFSDFQCPYCKRHAATMDKVLEDYQGQVRLVFRHFPLSSIHPYAQKAAEASECAGEQGKFWQMHDMLFANQSALTVDDLKSYAGELGLNTSQFNDCLDSGKYTSKVAAHFNEGRAAGVTGTPATFVNGQLIKGALPYEQFKAVIESLLK